MGIEKVGNQGVYVITGSGRDPRKTSTGQSWADLITKQKYMLFKEAHDQAMREYEAGQITAKERAKRIEGIRKELMREQRDISRAEQQLRRQQLRGEERRGELEYREKAKEGLTSYSKTTKEGGGSGGTGGTKGTRGYRGVKQEIPTQRAYLRTLNSDIEKISRQTNQLEARQRQLEASIPKQKIQKNMQNDLFGFIADPANETELTYQQNSQIIQGNNRRIDKLRSDLQKIEGYKTREQFEEWYKENELPTIEFTGAVAPTPGTSGTEGEAEDRTSTTYRSKTRKEPLGTLEGVDYSAVQDELAGRKADVQKDLDILEAMERQSAQEPFDFMGRRREIYNKEFGREPRRRRDREVENEFLGTEAIPEDYSQPVEEETDVVAEEVAKGQVIDRPITAPTAQRYTVKEGDTLGGISQQYYGDPARYTEIAEASKIQDPNRLSVGQELMIPQDQPQMPAAQSQQPMVDEVVEQQSISPELTPAPAPTPTPRVQRLGRMSTYAEAMKQTPADPIRQQFEQVKNLGQMEKQEVAFRLLNQAKQAYGVSSKEYEKTKKRILSELAKTLDPKQARNMRKVKSLQDNKPGQYHLLGDDIRGLTKETKNFVVSLFPVNDDTKTEEIESLYKNAQQQIRLGIADKSQKKKALDMLDLMYLAVIQDKR